MIPIIHPIGEPRTTPYSDPETKTVGVWHVTDQLGNEKTISVTKEGKALKYSQDDIICRSFKDVELEYSDYLRTPEKPRDEREDDTEQKKQKLRLKKHQYDQNLLKAIKQRPIHSIFLIDIFRSIIQENLKDCIRHKGFIGESDSGFSNFLPVIEKQGYIATPERGKLVYKPLDNINVVLFGMFDVATRTMVFARWGVFNRSTKETQSFSVHERDSGYAFKFLKNFKRNTIKKREEFGKKFKPIVEMDDDRISNISLLCFSELEKNTIISDKSGAITVISKKCDASGYLTGHAMLFYEYVDFEAFKHMKKVAHITPFDENGRSIAGGNARVDISECPWVAKVVEMKGPTWVRPIEDIKRLERSIIRGRRVPFSMFSDVIDTSVASCSRGYLSYIFDGSAYLAPVVGMGIAANDLGAVCAEGYVAAGLVGGAAAGGAVLGVAAVGGYAAYHAYSYIGNYLSDKVTEWQNRDKTDDYSRNCISWARHQLSIAGIKISVPKFNFTPKDVITHLNSNEGAVVLD